MAPALDNVDDGDDVVSSTGEDIGMVTEVRENVLYVDPDPSVTDEVKAALGWSDSDGGTYPLDRTRIEDVTGDEVRVSPHQ